LKADIVLHRVYGLKTCFETFLKNVKKRQKNVKKRQKKRRFV